MEEIGKQITHFSLKEKEESSLEDIFHELTDLEKEDAARSSFRFLLLRGTAKTNGDFLDDEQKKHAYSMARRYLRAKKSRAVAVAKMKETLAFRRQYDIDTLRLCFCSDLSSKIVDADRAAKLRQDLAEAMAQAEVFVQGYDKTGRALWIGVPRSTRSFEPTAYIRSSIYTLERAIACSEANGQDQVTAILDYEGYNHLRHNPPLHLSQQVLSTLRNHYVGRLHRIYLVNAPWTMRTLWKILKPFAGRETRQKLVFVSNCKDEKERILGPVVDSSQATTWMLPNGQQVNGPIDLKRFLDDIPFDQPYTS